MPLRLAITWTASTYTSMMRKMSSGPNAPSLPIVEANNRLLLSAQV